MLFKINFIGWVGGWLDGWLEKVEIKPTQPAGAGAGAWQQEEQL